MCFSDTFFFQFFFFFFGEKLKFGAVKSYSKTKTQFNQSPEIDVLLLSLDKQNDLLKLLFAQFNSISP